MIPFFSLMTPGLLIGVPGEGTQKIHHGGRSHTEQCDKSE